MVNNASRLNNEWIIVRQTGSGGNIVHKTANYPLIPDELFNHPELVFISVPSASALTDREIDRSEIDPDSELANLMAEHWAVTDFS